MFEDATLFQNVLFAFFFFFLLLLPTAFSARGPGCGRRGALRRGSSRLLLLSRWRPPSLSFPCMDLWLGRATLCRPIAMLLQGATSPNVDVVSSTFSTVNTPKHQKKHYPALLQHRSLTLVLKDQERAYRCRIWAIFFISQTCREKVVSPELCFTLFYKSGSGGFWGW